MLNAQLLNKTRREDSTRKRPSENRSKFTVKTSDPHILKLEIRLDDCIWRGSFRGSFYPDGGIGSFEATDLSLGSQDAADVSRRRDTTASFRPLFFEEGEIDAFD